MAGSWLRCIADGVALLPPAIPRFLWVHGGEPEQFASAQQVIAGLREAAPGGRLVLTSSSSATLEWLAVRFASDIVRRVPWNLAGPARRFFGAEGAALIVLLESDKGFPPRALARARALDVPVVALDIPPDSGSLAAIVPLLPGGGAPASAAPMPSWLDPLTRGRTWRRVAPLLRSRRIDDWEALRRRLGEPRSVLCLGNGPSSEERSLLGVRHECLMRVNWRWRGRRFLDRPDVVFVGDPRTVHKVRSCILAFLDESLEDAVLLRHLLSRGLRRAEYFTMRRISGLIRDGAWPARPTNGSLMVVAAVALRPEHLVIAGIDLYRHVGGAYPGEPRAPNEYARVHRREVEVAIIARALAGFRGEVTIVGESLQEALAAPGAPRVG